MYYQITEEIPMPKVAFKDRLLAMKQNTSMLAPIGERSNFAAEISKLKKLGYNFSTEKVDSHSFKIYCLKTICKNKCNKICKTCN